VLVCGYDGEFSTTEQHPSLSWGSAATSSADSICSRSDYLRSSGELMSSASTGRMADSLTDGLRGSQNLGTSNGPVISLLLVVIPSSLSMLLFPHFGAAMSIAVCFITNFATLMSSIVLYRTSPWHPLLCFPGALIAKTSRSWSSRGGIVFTWNTYMTYMAMWSRWVCHALRNFQL
jgi:hypothetical protein